ncbi:hypothetical protein MASR2M69_14060 [Bacteroidota bacterium]
MKTTNLLLIMLILTVLGVLPAGAQQQPQRDPGNSGWELIWRDEFNGKTLDKTKWNVLTRETSKHDELQYYVPDEVYLENGSLRIRSRVRDFGNKKFTSGRLDTKDKLAITYGRIEIRGKLPVGKGMWPAYWLYPQNRDWLMERAMQEAVEKGLERYIPEFRPWYTEIDIMEFLGHESNIVYATFHYQSFKGERRVSSATYTGKVNYGDDFHLYVLEWEADAIRWYLDGELIHTAREGVPHSDHFLIINTAIGGSWPGNPDSTTVFPQFHDVDYVRVYKRKQ